MNMEKFIPIYQLKNFDGINSVALLLGQSCNMQCRHCFQIPSRSHCVTIKYDILDKVQVFLDSFIEYHIRNKTGIGKSDEYKPKIMFWGGEPLLHWDFIKDFIIKAHEKFGKLREQGFVFFMVSNGLLLTQDKVDFLNQYGICFNFSYEAPYPFAIRGYVSDDICKLVNKIKHSEVLCTCFSKYNCDPLLAYRCLKAKFPNVKQVSVNMRIIKSFAFPNDIMDYNWDIIRKNFSKLRIAAKLGDKFALYCFRKLFLGLRMKSPDRQSYRVLDCVHKVSGLSVSLDGKCSLCGNLDNFNCTVDNTIEELLSYAIKISEALESMECNFCRHSDICYKHCMLDMKDKDGNFVTCKLFWQKFYDIVKEQLLKLANPLDDSEIDWYRKQERLMEEQIQAFLLEGKRYEKEKTRISV